LDGPTAQAANEGGSRKRFGILDAIAESNLSGHATNRRSFHQKRSDSALTITAYFKIFLAAVSAIQFFFNSAAVEKCFDEMQIVALVS
jgi:hypothetical protein